MVWLTLDRGVGTARAAGRRHAFPSIGLSCLLALLLGWPPSPIHGSPADAEEIPYETRQEILRRLGDLASDVSGAHASGAEYGRATYSKRIETDGDRYRVSFTRQAAAAERMYTDRYLLTFGRLPDDRWDVISEELQESYDCLVRDRPGDETFHRFESFQWQGEGLFVRGGSGSLVLDRLLGDLHTVRIVADDLAFDYLPPTDIGPHQRPVFRHLRQERQADLAFSPDQLLVRCSPQECHSFLQHSFSGLIEVQRDGIDPVLERFQADEEERTASLRRQDPFAGFQTVPDPEQRFVSLRIRRRGDDHWFALRQDATADEQVTVSVTGYGRLYGYPATSHRGSGDPRELELRADAEARDFDLIGLTGEIEIALEDSETLAADVVVSLRLRRDLREIPFAFNDVSSFIGRRNTEADPSITIDALRIRDGADLTWVRLGAARGLVVLPETMAAGVTIDLRIAFTSRGSLIKLNPSYSYMDRGGWLPFVRFGDRIDRFDLTVRAPEQYKVLGIGRRVEDSVDGEIRRSRFIATSPVQFPTLIFGDYFEDTPRTKALRLDGSEIPVSIHVDRQAMTGWGIRGKQLRPLAEQAVNALNIYRTLYGTDYPYAKLDLVNDPLGFVYGQSPASIIYLGSGVFRSPTTLNSVNPSGILAARARTLVAHEVAHQWWGSSIAHANRRHYWFVESLAEYSAALVAEIVESNGFRNPQKGREAYLELVDRWRQAVVDSDLLASVQDASTEWSNGGRAVALYAKGPYFFHILRETFGDDRFLDFMNRLGQELAGLEIVTRDIQAVAERAFGGIDEHGTPFNADLEPLFDQWIRGIGIPEYRFSYTTRPAEDGNWIVSGTIRQRVLAGKKNRLLQDVFFRASVPITILGKDRTEYPARIVVDGPETAFAFKVPVEPREVTLNKYGETLARDVIVE